MRTIMKTVLTAVLALLLLFAPVPAGASVSSVSSGNKAIPVSVRTELDTYSSITPKILVYLENNSDKIASRGVYCKLERKQGAKWVQLKLRDNVGFATPFYSIQPGETEKIICDMDIYADTLEPGQYRVRMDFSLVNISQSGQVDIIQSYDVNCGFAVVENINYKGVSELDAKGLTNYRDITWASVFQKTSAHIYKNASTYDTVVVYKGKQYPIGYGTGGWGVSHMTYFKPDENEYLIYVYSWGDDKTRAHRSHIGVFNLTTCKEVYTSQGFYGEDISFSPAYDSATEKDIPNQFTVFGGKYEEYKNGGYSAESGDKLGILAYGGGRFVLYESANIK